MRELLLAFADQIYHEMSYIRDQVPQEHCKHKVRHKQPYIRTIVFETLREQIGKKIVIYSREKKDDYKKSEKLTAV